MRILQYKRSKLAFAPDEIARVINKYTDHQSFISGNEENFTKEKTDFIHFHNGFKSLCGIKSCIQYHSEPKKVKLDFPGRKLVISQYHATLEEYKDCTIVRNPIDFEKDIYEYVRIDDKIRIGYSPSTKTKDSEWADKGYEQTKEILEKLKEQYKISYDIIHNTTLLDCILRKSRCNIIIDECITTSFHRSALEGLALGKYTICSYGKEVADVIKKVTNQKLIPFENVWIDGLYEYLERLIKDYDMKTIVDRGMRNREWMYRYWHPKTIANEYIRIYEEEMKK